MANVARDEQVIREVVDAANSTVRDEQVVREVATAASSVVRDEQVHREVVDAANAKVRDFQVFREVIVLAGVRDEQVVREVIDTANANLESFQVFREVIITPPGAQTLQVVREVIFIPKNWVDQPSIQVHPLVKPLDFLSRPLTQAGKRGSSFSTFLTEPGANRAFSMPMGARNQPIAGKVFAFTMGGTITPGTVGGSMVITPLYGATSSGVNLGSSALQFYPASTNALPWRLKGEIIFQTVDLTPGTALVVCSGVFMMSGDPTALDSGVELLFGSVNPIQVDLSAVGAVASGALNFAVSFGPSVFNVTPPTISTQYAFLRRF